MPHGVFSGFGVKVASTIAGCVWQCMVRSPVTLYLSPATFSIFVDLKVISGHLAASKKSGLLRWPSRLSLCVSIEAASIFTTTLLLVGSSLSKLSVEETLLNSPRTVFTIMCLTAKEAVVWGGSASSSTVAAKEGAARRRAARKIFMLDLRCKRKAAWEAGQAICQSRTTDSGSPPEARYS